MANFLTWIMGLIGVVLLIKAIVGSIAGGMNQARARMDGTAPAADVAERAQTSALRKSVLPLVGGVLLLACLVYQFWSRSRSREEHEASLAAAEAKAETQGAVPTEPEELDRFLAQSEAETLASAKRAELASAKARQQLAVTLGKKVLEAIGEWDQELDRWEAEVIALVSDDRGKVLAAQPQYVRRYRAILAAERPGREEAESLRSTARTLLEPVEDAYEDPANAMLPDESLTAQLEDLLGRARAGRDAYRTPRIQIQTLVTHATSSGGPGAKTLREAIAEQEAEESIAATELIAAEEEAARLEREAQVAAARREQIEVESRAEVERIKAETEAKRLIGEEEVRRLAEEAEAARTRFEQEAAARRAEQEREQLRRAFAGEWPAMRPYLTPFTTPGYTQPGGHGYERTAEKGPVSLGKLKARGWLEQNIDSLRDFHAKTTMNRMNDRDRGGFPGYGGPGTFDANQQLIQRIQDFLVTYGEILVEEGHLAP